MGSNISCIKQIFAVLTFAGVTVFMIVFCGAVKPKLELELEEILGSEAGAWPRVSRYFKKLKAEARASI